MGNWCGSGSTEKEEKEEEEAGLEAEYDSAQVHMQLQRDLRLKNIHLQHDKVYHAMKHPHLYVWGDELKYVEGFVGQFDDNLQDSDASSEEMFWFDKTYVIPINRFDYDTVFEYGIENCVVIRFHDSQCPVSQTTTPFYHKLSAAFPKVIFLDVDILDVDITLSPAVEIQHTPTFVLYKSGQEMHRLVGINPDDLHDMIFHHAPHY